MKNTLIALSVLCLLLASSCDEIEGCTDPSSLNYDQDATLDDGSCLYVADAYVGTYQVTDTVGNQDTVYTRQYTMEITKVHRGAVTLNGFHDGACSPKALVTMSSMVLEDARGDCGFNQFVASFDDGVLLFDYFADTNNFTMVAGRALWTQ